MNGAINLDHLAIPATDGERSENFYMNLLGLKLQMRRYNPNGKLRQRRCHASYSVPWTATFTCTGLASWATQAEHFFGHLRPGVH